MRSPIFRRTDIEGLVTPLRAVESSRVLSRRFLGKSGGRGLPRLHVDNFWRVTCFQKQRHFVGPSIRPPRPTASARPRALFHNFHPCSPLPFPKPPAQSPAHPPPVQCGRSRSMHRRVLPATPRSRSNAPRTFPRASRSSARGCQSRRCTRDRPGASAVATSSSARKAGESTERYVRSFPDDSLGFKKQNGTNETSETSRRMVLFFCTLPAAAARDGKVVTVRSRRSHALAFWFYHTDSLGSPQPL